MTFAEKTHLLVVDDDNRIRELLLRYLTQGGYVVVAVESAAAASDALAIMNFDLVILDVMMPGMTGTEWARALRAQGVDTPILLLTAMGEAGDRIKGLESGVDDYLVKPFEPRELQLRIEAILRRRPAPDLARTRFKLGEWQIDLAREEITGDDGQAQKLTAVDIKLLRALLARAGQVVARDDLAAACGVNPDERTIDVQITRLRRKLNDDPRTPRFIATLRGQGYELRTDYLTVG